MKRYFDEVDADHADGVYAEESDDRVAPHDAAKEESPRSPYFSNEYRALINGIDNVVTMLEAPLKGTGYRDATTDGLLAEIKQRTETNFPEEVRIALVGDMKSGKSSVINSILSIGMIARQGDAGCSCTWVVQEFGHLFPHQDKPYAAQVHFFSANDQHEIMRNLVHDYFHAANRDEEAAEGPKDSDQALEDFATKRTVVTALRAVFSDHAEFATPAAADEFLSSVTCEDDEHIVDKLCDWADELMSKQLGKESYILAKAATTQNLLWQLAPYMYTVELRDGEPSPSLWPFVSYIKFGLEIPILENGITLVDLPGLSDANKTRVDNAMKHLRLCTYYMVVAEIGRADDDKFIRDALRKGQTTRGDARTILVLTHADAIDDETEVKGTSKEYQVLHKLKNETKDFEGKKTEIIKSIKLASKGIARYELMDEKASVSGEIRSREMQYREVRIRMRSRMVSRQMQELYGELTTDPIPLPVFCVGNAAYKKHQAGYAVDDPNSPSLTVEGTNIPALRKHLLLTPAEAKLNEARHMVATQLPTLLSCFRMIRNEISRGISSHYLTSCSCPRIVEV